jgi:DHA1 family bicyclomycin/chloramphenicol resistance-like MFS transporter
MRAASNPIEALPNGVQAEGQSWRVLAVLSALLGFASISTDFYLPALPTMAASLGSDPGMVAFTISGYLIGFSLGQLL